MSHASSPSTNRRYGVSLVSKLVGVARSTIYAARARDRDDSDGPVPRRRGPRPRYSDLELGREIRAILDSSPFVGEGHRKVWAKLRFRGIRTSRERVLRLMREMGVLAPSRVGTPRGPRSHDGTITTDAPDEMWGTDLTTTLTRLESSASVFVLVDHCTNECLGIHASKRGTRFEALEPLRQAVPRSFGAFEPGVATKLKLRHDNGTQFVSDVFQKELRFLGIESSPSFVRAPEGNGCAERFIRTLKEQLLWVRTFDTVEELRLALHAWARTYNDQWIVERHGYRTPTEVRRALTLEVAA